MSLSEEDRKEAERLASEIDSYASITIIYPHLQLNAAHQAANMLRRLSAQPAQVPMTKGEIREFLTTNCIPLGKSFSAMLTDREAVEVVRFIESHHGIGGKP